MHVDAPLFAVDPIGQGVQYDAPDDATTDPVGQGTHSAVPGAHLSQDVLPMPQVYVPGGHWVHKTAGELLNVPGQQG